MIIRATINYHGPVEVVVDGDGLRISQPDNNEVFLTADEINDIVAVAKLGGLEVGD